MGQEKIMKNIFLVIRDLMKAYESEVGSNLKIRSIYMPHYENKYKHWMSGAIKRIDHAMKDEAREFANLQRECPEGTNEEGNECTEEKIKLENELVNNLYKVKLDLLKE